MQKSELEKKKNNLLGDEECINFRPSPNFKNMRKYLKSKCEEANSSPNQSSDPSTPNSEEQETIKPVQGSSGNMAQRVQPPLPPNSPPPELVVPKQEIVDEEYDRRDTAQVLKTEKEEEKTDRPSKIMCRQFIRGTCVRGASCIYVHEVILTQLPGVYTFCKNFQNSVCKLEKCKFVHATVFEKEHFYRTGYLPPHTLIHLKESNSALAPANAIEGPVEGSQAHSNPPPVSQPGISSLPTSGNVPPEARANTELFNQVACIKRSISPKREWSEVAGNEHDGGPIAKKCKMCDVNELRLQCCKMKIQSLKEKIDDTKKKRLQIIKNENKLNRVISLLVKTKTNTTSASMKLYSSVRNDNESHADPLTSILQIAGRVDNSQKMLLIQILKDFLIDKSSDHHPPARS